MLQRGAFVVQYLNSFHRYGVISRKKTTDERTGWSYFEVMWDSGESSVERADQLKMCRDIDKTISELMNLRRYCK